jgi:hypothetical protein
MITTTGFGSEKGIFVLEIDQRGIGGNRSSFVNNKAGSKWHWVRQSQDGGGGLKKAKQ